MSRYAKFLVPLLIVLFAVQALTAVRTKSATWDETNYIGMGDYLLKQGRWDVPSAVIHPPLAYYLDSLPLLWEDFDRSGWTYPAATTRDLAFLGAADIGRGQAILSSPANRHDRLLTRVRAMVILQALLLGYAVYRLGAALHGAIAGVLALFFFAFNPEMLAHGALITPDMTLTVFCFTTMALFRQSLIGERLSYHVLAGVSLGLALLSKFPALLLLPVEAVILGFVFATRRRLPLMRLALSWACALILLLLAYRFDLGPYFQGLEFQRTSPGHWSYLMGELSSEGWWYYILAAFALKTPVPLLACFVIALLLLITKGIRRTITLDDLVIWLPIVAFFAFFCVELRSIGLRYVLPAYPFIFVAAAGALWRLRQFKYLVAVPLLWYGAATLAARPHYLAYFNELSGGPANGYRYLVDSNLDWGQDLKGLKQFMDSRGIDRVYLSYFGTDSPERYGIAYDWLPSYELKNPDAQATSINIEKHRYLAISVTNLQGVYMEPKEMFRWLDKYTPIARIGHSIFVYYLE
jgi:hypothetical protein